MKPGPNTPYISPTQQEEICERLINGEQTFKILKTMGIPWNWLPKYAAVDPLFSKELKNARELAMHCLVETLITITDDCESIMDVHAARIKSENIKWSASKIVPAVYGENINLNVNHHLDLSSVLLAAENRVIPILQAKQALLAPIASTPTPVPDIEVLSNEGLESGFVGDMNGMSTINNISIVDGSDSSDSQSVPIPDELKDLI